MIIDTYKTLKLIATRNKKKTEYKIFIKKLLYLRNIFLQFLKV